MRASGHSNGTCDLEQAALVAFPATVAQQAFWFLDQLAPTSAAFNVAVRFHLAGPLDPDLVARVLNEIIRRHEVLRTRFEEEDGDVLQVVLPSVQIRVRVTDLSHLAESLRNVEVARLGSLEAETVFDLRQAPLFRANLLRLSEEEYMLQITVHHAVSDGWSIGLIADEFAVLYEAFAGGRTSPLPELPIQFADYALWQEEYLRGPEIEAQLAFWKRKLQNRVELSLPTDFVRPAVKTWQGDIVSVVLPRPLTDRLQVIAQRNGATLSMLFCAAFKVLLSRYTGQTDISIGTPIAGRTRAEVEKLIGVFINTVILRTSLDGNPAFDHLLRSVRDTVVEAVENQDLPFELLVKELMPERDLARNPLFQVNFTYQRDFVKPVKFVGVQLTPVPSRPAGAIFDLHLFMVERDDGWRASCDFNTGLIRPDTAVRMLSHFRQLLESVAANPEASINEICLLPPDEQRLTLVDWNATSREFPRDVTVHALIERQASANPERIAVRCAKDALTYAQLDREAGRLAKRLNELAVTRGTLVGLCVERSLDMVIGVLGILKAGAAYVPMDPTFPSQRLACMVEDTQMPVIVVQESLLGRLPPHQARIVVIDRDLPQGPIEPGQEAGAATDLMYVIFTSGSTGRPKGVKITHRSVVNFLNSMRREPGMEPDDVMLSVTTLSFDIAGMELLLPLITGATLVVATRETVLDAERMARELELTGATVMQATPVTWQMLLASGWKGSARLKALVGGEAVPRELVNELASRCASLWNMYGPTETTIWSTVGRLEAREGAVCIGRPIDNTRIYIVSSAMQPQPIGIPGELLIGGDGLAAGYLNRDELTAEKFISDPFDRTPGARLYRTGDLARWRADGTLECLGRMDEQVKIRGFRIELGEIESVLGTHPDVRQSAVVAREDSPGERRLVGYFVPAAGRNPKAEELREHLRQRLPEHMLPSGFVALGSLPLTPNGKIDRKRLPPPGLAEAQRSVVAPRTSAERQLMAIFTRVLRTTVASIHDSFFDLGGHSLLAVKLMASIKTEFGVRLPLAQLLSAPTVAQLARALVVQPANEGRWASLVPISPQPGKTPIFLVHGAGGNVLLYRWLARHLAPDYPVYGLQSRGLGGGSAPLGTIEEMAVEYLKEIRAVQPRGPYSLGGYCLGGTVAYEMAQLLHEAGEEVTLLAMLDTYNFSRAMRPSASGFMLEKLRFHVGNLVGLRPHQIVNYIAEKVRVAREGELANLLNSNPRELLDADASPGKTGIENQIQAMNHQAACYYQPRQYAGRLTLFKPRVNYKIYSDPNMGWADLARGGLDIVELPVNPHAMLVEPFVGQLAAELKVRLRPVRQEARLFAPT
jgi:amino acid adenylation domain-containing protein